MEILDSLNQLVSSTQWGLTALFVLCFLSSTLLPLSSEPALLLYLSLYPDRFWLAIGLASLGNTLGGVVNYVLGAKSLRLIDPTNNKHALQERHGQISEKLQTMGPPLLLLSWLPIVGDPMCMVAGFLKLPMLSSVLYMAMGKFLRYVILAYGLMSTQPLWGPYLKALLSPA